MSSSDEVEHGESLISLEMITATIKPTSGILARQASAAESIFVASNNNESTEYSIHIGRPRRTRRKLERFSDSQWKDTMLQTDQNRRNENFEEFDGIRPARSHNDPVSLDIAHQGDDTEGVILVLPVRRKKGGMPYTQDDDFKLKHGLSNKWSIPKIHEVLLPNRTIKALAKRVSVLRKRGILDCEEPRKEDFIKINGKTTDLSHNNPESTSHSGDATEGAIMKPGVRRKGRLVAPFTEEDQSKLEYGLSNKWTTETIREVLLPDRTYIDLTSRIQMLRKKRVLNACVPQKSEEKDETQTKPFDTEELLQTTFGPNGSTIKLSTRPHGSLDQMLMNKDGIREGVDGHTEIDQRESEGAAKSLHKVKRRMEPGSSHTKDPHTKHKKNKIQSYGSLERSKRTKAEVLATEHDEGCIKSSCPVLYPTGADSKHMLHIGQVEHTLSSHSDLEKGEVESATTSASIPIEPGTFVVMDITRENLEECPTDIAPTNELEIFNRPNNADSKTDFTSLFQGRIKHKIDNGSGSKDTGYVDPPKDLDGIHTTKSPTIGERMSDNVDTYIEETTWRSHGSTVLHPLALPSPLPPFPHTKCCVWTFDDQARVLLGKFCSDVDFTTVNSEDQEFLLDMMERDDITVITEGHANDLDPELWSLKFLKQRVGDKYHHKFRLFTKQGTYHQEVDGFLVMKVSSYIEYLNKKEAVMLKKHSGQLLDKELEFLYSDADGQQRSLDLLNDVVYMIDFDMVKMLPELHEDLVAKLKLAQCLPGGKQCMLNAVNQNARPFMGPNIYLTPGGSFTTVHQDGFGTVDSGHLCLSGYNEVIMLRRVPENHKANALRLLYGETSYDPLHELPHGDRLGDKPSWPTHAGVARCKKMNYCPSVFILSAGQQVHINKGRLHAFRKLTPEPLAENDCHKDLRNIVVNNTPFAALLKQCISVAWDWMYLGHSCEGVNREVVSILECSAINRVLGKMSLAIPELCILELARKHISRLVSAQSSDSFLPSAGSLCSIETDRAMMILTGILPALRVVVEQHVKISEEFTEGNYEGIHVAKRPNSWENPALFALDPYGNSDFFCKICSCELSNNYMHCDGCENLLFKDFNICVQCHAEEKYVAKISMHPCKPDKRHCAINHVGNTQNSNTSRCPCKNGPACSYCSYCLGCSCRCHRSFTLHQRLLNSHDEIELLKCATAIVGDKIIPYSDDVAPRLQAAIKGATNKLALLMTSGTKK